MKRTQHIFTSLIVPICLSLFSCTDELPDVSGRNFQYELVSVSDDLIAGQVRIRERNDGTTQLELTLNGIDPDGIYPAYIHFGNYLEGGGIAITLNPVDGQSESKVTEISTLDSGTLITFDELLQFDGHLNVQLDDDQGVVAAHTDIGINALTGRFQQFLLVEENTSGASGIITIEQRESGFSLVTVELEGSIPGELHPVTLNFGSMQAPAGVAGTLNPVEGSSGIGKTHVEELDGALVAPYEALVEFNGFVRVHLGNGADMNTILAQGNIAYIEN